MTPNTNHMVTSVRPFHSTESGRPDSVHTRCTERSQVTWRPRGWQCRRPTCPDHMSHGTQSDVWHKHQDTRDEWRGTCVLFDWVLWRLLTSVGFHTCPSGNNTVGETTSNYFSLCSQFSKKREEDYQCNTLRKGECDHYKRYPLVVDLRQKVKVEYLQYRGLLPHPLVVSFINPHSCTLIHPRSYCCLPPVIGETDSRVKNVDQVGSPSIPFGGGDLHITHDKQFS